MRATRPLALFWFLYMGGLGLVFPYQSLYFHENAGLDGGRLGLLLALRPLLGMLFQPLWGHAADRSGRRAGVLVLLALGTAAGYALLPLARSFAALLAAVGFTAVFVTSVIPTATAVSLASLERPTERFGRVRVWGTLGFLLCVVGFPSLLERLQAARGLAAEPGGPSEPGLEVLFWLAAGLTLLAAAAGAALPRGSALALRAGRGELAALLRHGPYLRLLLFTFLAYFFLQAPIQLFPVFLRDRGGSLDTLGQVWVAMLVLEIPLVFYTGAALRRVGPRGLLAVGVAADGLRWLGSALAPSLGVLFALQLLHGVTIAGLVVGVAMAVEGVAPERLRATGQAGVAMVGISLASVLSNACGGFLLERYGAAAPYFAGGAGALLLAASIPWLLPPRHGGDPREGAQRQPMGS